MNLMVRSDHDPPRVFNAVEENAMVIIESCRICSKETQHLLVGDVQRLRGGCYHCCLREGVVIPRESPDCTLGTVEPNTGED